MTKLTVEHILKLPVTELRVGDEFWGDVIPNDTDELELEGTSMMYRLEEGPLQPQRNQSRIVFLVRWADGGSSHREWTQGRRLTVRRAHD